MKNNQITKLFTDGKITTKKGREFTRLMGGFGDGKPIITIKQIADLMNYNVKTINQTINRNIDNFKKDEGYIKDLKEVTESDHNLEVLKPLGYNKMSISKAKNIYILSQAGFLLYLKFAEGDKAIGLYKDFIEDYFKIKAENKVMKETLQDELKEVKEDKALIYGKLIMETDEIQRIELAKQLENINERIIKISSTIENKQISKALDKQSHLTESKESYLTQSEFGDRFNCKIGAKMVGKILKIVGLAKQTVVGRTVPYRTSVPEFAYNELNNNTEKAYEVNYRWNYNKCIKVIDKWLKEHSLYEKFYSITDKQFLEDYISGLFTRFVIEKDDEEYEKSNIIINY